MSWGTNLGVRLRLSVRATRPILSFSSLRFSEFYWTEEFRSGHFGTFRISDILHCPGFLNIGYIASENRE